MGDGNLDNSMDVEVLKKGYSDEDSISRDHIKDNPLDGNVRKTKTVQHLLSDGRTAYAINKKVILLDLSSYLINLFSGNNCWEHNHSQFISTTSILGSMQQGRSENWLKGGCLSQQRYQAK